MSSHARSALAEAQRRLVKHSPATISYLGCTTAPKVAASFTPFTYDVIFAITSLYQQPDLASKARQPYVEKSILMLVPEFHRYGIDFFSPRCSRDKVTYHLPPSEPIIKQDQKIIPFL